MSRAPTSGIIRLLSKGPRPVLITACDGVLADRLHNTPEDQLGHGV